jgi:predicted nucleotidyltransferase
MKDRNADVVRCLLENTDKELNILSIAKSVKMNYKNVFDIVKRLEKEKIVTLKKFGSSNKVEINRIIHPLIFEAEYERRKDILADKNILVILNQIKKDMESSLYILLLFGSYAKKKQAKGSDIDLMFIVPNESFEKFEMKVNQTARLIPLPIHHMTFSEEQFLDMIKAKEFNVGKEAMKNSIILYGIENYYELIK